MVQVVRRNAPEQTVIRLKPNEKLVLPKEAAIEAKILSEELAPASTITPASFTISKIDSTKKESERLETAWLYSRLEFRGDSFEELALKLERWYNVSIIFTDEEVKKLNVNGSFEKETVEQALAALKEGFPISYKINNNNEIYIGSSR
jgi:ferric-dicitrate binding protein FerR (iron transport regulator)